MIGLNTQRMLDRYIEEAPAPMFLSSLFTSPPRNYHTTEKVTVDIKRDSREVAVPVPDVSVGSRKNQATVYQNKGFTPPVFDEEGAITAHDLMKRRAGDSPFDDPNYGQNAMDELVDVFVRLQNKIKRATELMAAQALQTGKIELKDASGNVIYTLDFGMKSSHKVNVGTDWGTVDGDGKRTDDPFGDVASTARVVRTDGMHRPYRLIFGEQAFEDFTSCPDFIAQSDNRRFDTAERRAPDTQSEGGTFHGMVSIGFYRYEMWTYDGSYVDPATGTDTPYVGTNQVIMLSRNGRLDLTFGAIPTIKRPDAAVQAFLPTRLSDAGRSLDLTVGGWFSLDGKALHVWAGTRPLTIPTAIDTIASINTRPA